MQKTNQKEFRVEKIFKRESDKLYVKWRDQDNSFNSSINKNDIISEYFQKPKLLQRRVKLQLDLANYATKANLKKVTGVDRSKFAKNVDLTSLKSIVAKLDIDKLKNVPTNLSNLKSKVDKLDIDINYPIDFSKLSDVVKNDVAKKLYI